MSIFFYKLFVAIDGLGKLNFTEISIFPIAKNYSGKVMEYYFTGRYDTREIILKPQVDPSQYITTDMSYLIDTLN